jgi:hypothetical protein
VKHSFAFHIQIISQFRTLTKKINSCKIFYPYGLRVSDRVSANGGGIHFQEKCQGTQLSQFIKCPRKSSVFFPLLKFSNYKERNFRQKLEKAEREKQEYKDLSDRQEARVSTFFL